MGSSASLARGRTARFHRLAAGLLALSACAHAPTVPARDASLDGELMRLRAELSEREQRIVQLEGRLALAEAGQRQLRGEVERLETAAALAPVPARETVRLGKREASKTDAKETRDEVDTREVRPLLRLDGTRRASASDTHLTSSWTPPSTHERLSVVPLPDAPVRPRASAPTPAVAPEPAPARAREDLYLRALDLLRRREFAEAERELRAFLAAHPDDPRVGRAHFFRGELLFSTRDFAAALAAFQASLAREPRGDKAPEAMLRSALCQLQLGRRAEARATMSDLRARFPESDAARRSQTLMQEDSG